MKMPSWLEVPREAFEVNDPTIVGTSGGLTSALMAFLYHHLGAKVEFCFWNTGREAPGTYDFLKRLGGCIPLRYFEVRKPAQYGAGPSQMGFAEVSFEELDRAGRPFRILLETLAEYRATQKGELPIGPNPVQRLCTAYMKSKLSNHVARAWWGEEDWTSAVGLRADEPRRVSKMMALNTEVAGKTSIAPLHKAGITKCHVEMFWKEQEFTLNIPAHQGNCTMCFLKDEADLADILANTPDPDGKNWEWWKELDDRFHIRGRGQAPYRQVEAEAPMRFSIRDSLVNIKPLPRSDDWDPRRYKLVLRQEQKILREGIKRVPCSCESAEQMDDEYILKQQQGCLF